MRKSSDFLDTSDRFLSGAKERGLMFRAAEDETIAGRTLTLGGRELLQFGSGSYLGLETDERLKEGAIDAIRRYGTQFPSSRAYVSAPLYPELESLLGDVFGMPAMVAASSTLAHVAAIPVLVAEGDAVILDQQVHATVQMATNHVRVLGVPVELVRHNRLDLLEERVAALSKTHRRVWYMADGVYSMYGDRAPMSALVAMLERHEKLHLYIDDAHGMSWTGRHGRGFALDAVSGHPRLTVITSLAKSFSSGGGVILVGDDETRRKIRTVGASMIFSGPLQPANLGAAIASAKLHLSGDITALQDGLRERIRLCNRLCQEAQLPLVATDEVPIRFIALGAPDVAYAMAERLMQDGFYSNAAVFPAVATQRSGLRFTMTNHQQMDDIERFVAAVSRHLPEVLAKAGTTLDEVRSSFGLTPTPSVTGELTAVVPVAARRHGAGLRLQHETTIEALNAREWDALLGDQGAYTAEALMFLERLYRDNERPEDNWRFHYYVVRDAADQVVLATFFTEGLWKDDMLAPAVVSRRIEDERRRSPYHLASKTFAMGSLLTEGRHLYLDRSLDWRAALDVLLAEVRRHQAAAEAPHLLLRDVPTTDLALDAYMTERGFARLAMPATMVLDLTKGAGPRQTRNARRHWAKSVVPFIDAYRIERLDAHSRPVTPAELAHFYALYRQVKDRALEINTFALPEDFFAHLFDSPNWEVMTLTLRPEFGGDVETPASGLVAAYRGSAHYVPLLVGMDDGIARSHGLYRQLLRHIAARAAELNVVRVDLGLGAELEKLRMGASKREHYAYFQSSDTFQIELLGQAFIDARAQSIAI